MASWLDRLLGRGRRQSGTTRRPAGVFETRESGTALNPVSMPEDASALGAVARDFVRLPNETPYVMLQVYRFLRDAIPDISDAVWTWKRLCQTGYDVEIVRPSSDTALRSRLRTTGPS